MAGEMKPDGAPRSPAGCPPCRTARTAGSTTDYRREVAVTQSRDVNGPHHLPQGEQERCAVAGVRIDASGQRDAVPLQDRKRRGVVLCLHGVIGLRVLIDDNAARTLAKGIGNQS